MYLSPIGRTIKTLKIRELEPSIILAPTVSIDETRGNEVKNKRMLVALLSVAVTAAAAVAQ